MMLFYFRFKVNSFPVVAVIAIVVRPQQVLASVESVTSALRHRSCAVQGGEVRRNVEVVSSAARVSRSVFYFLLNQSSLQQF